MSITTEIQRLQDCVSNAYSACISKGATIPQTRNSANLPSTIQTISTAVRDKNEIPKYELETISGDYCAVINSDITVTNKFDDIDEINSGLQYAFDRERNIHGDLIFTKLKKVTGDITECFMYNVFDEGTTISFPSLEEINTSWYSVFSHTKNVDNIIFGALKTIDGDIRAAFANAKSVSSTHSSIQFPLLQTIGQYATFTLTFSNSGLTSMSFPSLTTIQNLYAFKNAFMSCPEMTEIHFKASIRTTVESMDGYSSMFGATNATIYFDL